MGCCCFAANRGNVSCMTGQQRRLHLDGKAAGAGGGPFCWHLLRRSGCRRAAGALQFIETVKLVSLIHARRLCLVGSAVFGHCSGGGRKAVTGLQCCASASKQRIERCGAICVASVAGCHAPRHGRQAHRRHPAQLRRAVSQPGWVLPVKWDGTSG